MKIVFLDMDGVLNSAWFKEPIHYIEPDKFNWLKHIISSTQAKVVLSTSWREFRDWKRFLTDFFACVDIEVIDGTPVIKDGEREDEIQSWLNDHTDVESFVILDDWDMRKRFPDNMVYTVDSGRIGLDEQFAKQAIEILNKPVK